MIAHLKKLWKRLFGKPEVPKHIYIPKDTEPTTSDLAQKLKADLRTLALTDIPSTLKELGFKGKRSRCSMCPIVSYLKWANPDLRTVEVSVGGVKATRKKDWKAPWESVFLDFGEQEKPIKTFIQKFDYGHFDELVEGGS